MAKQVYLLFVLIMILTASPVLGQSNANWLENTMFTSGKINVVVGVIAIVFILLVIYLISIDRKLGKLEKTEKNKEQ